MRITPGYHEHVRLLCLFFGSIILRFYETAGLALGFIVLLKKDANATETWTYTLSLHPLLLYSKFRVPTLAVCSELPSHMNVQ